MRLLFLTNFFPPINSGGYPQLCQDVADGLKNRGHQIAVLTSSFLATEAPSEESEVFRSLPLDGDLYYYRPVDFFLNWKSRQRRCRQVTSEIIQRFRPDSVVVWGMRGISKVVPAEVERQLGSRVVYYLADQWPTQKTIHESYWQETGKRSLLKIPRKLLGNLACRIIRGERIPRLRLEHCLFVSSALRDLLLAEGMSPGLTKVVHNGIDFEAFAEHHNCRNDWPERPKLLYAGLLAPHKGVHTAVEALSLLSQSQEGLKRFSLTILGSGHPDYVKKLRASAAEKGLADAVEFRPKVPREKMPDVLSEFHVLVFPSQYQEPLARIVQEAMASGLLVIGTTTGGMQEILRHQETGLTFSPGDARQLANRIQQAVRSPELRAACIRTARHLVQKKFNIDRTVTDIEKYLSNLP